MDFSLSDEQILLQQQLDKAFRQAVPIQRVRDAVEQHDRFPADVWQAICTAGVPGLLVPEESGGLGGTLLDSVLVAEVMGRHAVPVSYLGPCVVAPLAFRLAGDRAQQRLVFPDIARGALKIAIGPAGAMSGSRDSSALICHSGKLHGRAVFVLDARGAERFLLADDKGALFIVDAAASGLRLTWLETVDGTRAVANLDLDGVPAEPLAHATPEITARLASAARLVLAADALGAANHMLEQAVAYASVREQFGRPIGSFQAVKHMCADMAAELEPGRALLWYAAHAWDQGYSDAPLAALHAKALISEAARFVARTATEVHGGIGITDALGLHFWFKRISFDVQVLGTPERLREEAAIVQGLISSAQCAVGRVA